MNRRHILAGLAAMAGNASRAALAQTSRQLRRVGILATTSERDPEWIAERAVFLATMEGMGWTEGRNLRVDVRFGFGDGTQLTIASQDLVRLGPDVLLARSTRAVRELRAETSTIPIVFVSVSDPVGEGFAASLARPGANVTGFTNIEPSMVGKWVQLLKEIAPASRQLGLLFNPDVAVLGGAYFARPLEAAASLFALPVHHLQVRSVAQLEQAVSEFGRQPGSALVVPPDAFLVANRAAVLEGAARARLPAIYAFRNMATEGGLLSYGVDVADLYRQSAAYVDRILKGESVGNLPIQAPTVFTLALNLKTARSLGLDIAPALLAQADEVIE